MKRGKCPEQTIGDSLFEPEQSPKSPVKAPNASTVNAIPMPLYYYYKIHCLDVLFKYQSYQSKIHGTTDSEFLLTFSPHILRIVLLVILPSLLKHLINAALFQNTLLKIRLFWL